MSTATSSPRSPSRCAIRRCTSAICNTACWGAASSSCTWRRRRCSVRWATPARAHDPPRGIQDDVTPSARAPRAREGVAAAYRALLRNRPYVLTVLGYAAYTFALGGMALYIVKFLERVRGVSEGQASVGFAAVVIATGLIGIALGGWLSDRLLKVTKQSYLWVSGIATLIAAPLALVGVTAATPAVYWTAIALG